MSTGYENVYQFLKEVEEQMSTADKKRKDALLCQVVIRLAFSFTSEVREAVDHILIQYNKNE